MSVNLIWAAMAAAAALSGQAAQPAPAPAPTPPAGAPSTEVDEVVVTGSRNPAEVIRNFVADVSAPVNGERQLARWDRTVCPGVAGLRGRYAQVLIDRLAVAAYRVGLDVGEPGCQPNIMIFATRDGNALAREIVEQNPRLVSLYGDTGNTVGRQRIRDFQNVARAVRWWHVTRTFTNDGIAVDRGDTVAVRGSGRLHRNTRQDFDRVIIVLDINQAQGVPFGVLSDYVAMVALAQLDPTARTDAYDTVLNLFSERREGRPGPTGLTEWDVAYLQGLYEAPRDARNAQQQEGEIARRVQQGATTPSTSR